MLFGYEIFERIFRCILTDNGGEFRRPDELEKSCLTSNKRCNIFYCDPNRSDQKGKLEKNHEYIRYIVPKGNSFDKYTQSNIDLMMSHINSTPRESLNFATPYDMANVFLGDRILSKLNICKINPDDVILKPYLLQNQ